MFRSTQLGNYTLDMYNGKMVVWATNHDISRQNIEEWVESLDLPESGYVWYENAVAGESDFYVQKPYDINSPEIQELVAKYENMIVTGDESEGYCDYPDLDVVFSTDKFVVLTLLEYALS